MLMDILTELNELVKRTLIQNISKNVTALLLNLLHSGIKQQSAS